MITGKICRKLKSNKGNALIKDLLKHTIFSSILYFCYQYLFSCLQLLHIQIVLKIQIVYYLVSLKQSLFLIILYRNITIQELRSIYSIILFFSIYILT